MEHELIVIDTPAEMIQLQEYLKDKEYIAIDTETSGLTKQDQVIGFSICAEETKAYYVILSFWEKDLKVLVDTQAKTYVKNFLTNLIGRKLIAHNAVFDCMMIESNFKISLIDSLHTDTMILAHLLDENRRVGLKELAKQYFGENSNTEQVEMKASIEANGGLITKDAYELYKADAILIGKYGAKDALLTYKLFMELIPELYEQQLDKFFYEDESMPLLKGPTYELNTTGLQVDTVKLLTLKKTLEAECLEAKEFIRKEIEPVVKAKYPGTNKKNVFNIGSNQQLAWLIFGEMGLEFGKLTDGGKEICRKLNMKIPYHKAAKTDFIYLLNKSIGYKYTPDAMVNGKLKKGKTVKSPFSYIACDKNTLNKLAPKHKWIAKLLEYKRKDKILTTYVKSIESKVKYGIISPSFLQHGTSSGRYSSKSPNFQNLPRDDERVKACVVARPGKVFVSADYSQLEPRVFAYYSGDKRLMDAFDGSSDFYSVVGIEVFDKYDATPQKEGSDNAFGVKYKMLRDRSKVIALASAYGATPHQLAPTTGMTIEQTEEVQNNYFERFPGVRTMMVDAHKLAKKQGFVTSHFGRPRRMPEAMQIPKNKEHAELPYEQRSLLNLAVNHRIQSTGGSLINRASIAFRNMRLEAGLDAVIAVQIHDELVIECNEQDAQDVSILLQHCMEATNELEGIRLEAEPRITKNLSKKLK